MSGEVSGLAILAALAALAAVLFLVSARQVTTIYPPMVGLLYRNGRFARELPPGRYARFDPFGRTKIVEVSTAEQIVELGEITLVSKDQFSFRLTLAPVLKVVDARSFAEAQARPDPFLGRRAAAYRMPVEPDQAAIRALTAAAALETAGAMTLAELMAGQQAVAGAIQAHLAQAVPGAAVDRVLLTGINLPPETRRMFTEVERARMEGMAALERARGEQSALRALANAARLVTDNPALANLRLLQAIEGAKGKMTVIVGNPAAGGVSIQSPSEG